MESAPSFPTSGWHAPATHALPTAHDVPAVPPVTPHPAVAPQNAALELGLMQLPPQRIVPPVQAIWQLDAPPSPAATQLVPVPHLFVHAPQLFGSLARFTHALPHGVVPPTHWSAHVEAPPSPGATQLVPSWH
jgi:hypothetical protein